MIAVTVTGESIAELREQLRDVFFAGEPEALSEEPTLSAEETLNAIWPKLNANIRDLVFVAVEFDSQTGFTMPELASKLGLSEDQLRGRTGWIGRFLKRAERELGRPVQQLWTWDASADRYRISAEMRDAIATRR